MGIVYSFATQAQNVAINNDNASAHASAILDVQSTTKGILVPRMTKTEKNAIASPATGLLVYQLSPDSIGFHYYNGTQWIWLNAASQVGWLTLGNTGTDPSTHFLGTTDNQALSFRQNNAWMGRWNTSTGNYFIGDSAGVAATGQKNIGIGSNALKTLTTGYDNVAIGDSAMKFSNGQSSEAIGSKALMNSNTGAYGNSAIGYESMYNTTTGTFNVAHGFRALKANTVGVENTAIGVGALEADTSGSYNTSVGRLSLFLNKKGSFNTGIGLASLYTNDSIGNTAIGAYSLSYNNRNYNTAVGFAAGHTNSFLQTSDANLGIENVYVGYNSGYNANTGSKNVGLGFRALQGQGYFNGDVPGNTYYKRNVAIGDSSMTVAYGSDNVAVGFKTLSVSGSSGGHVAIGSRALNNTTAAYPNTAVGYLSQDSTTTAGANTSVGSYSLSYNKTGYNNVAIGNAAMYQATGNNVIDNTAVGNDALRFTTANANTAIGAGALRNNTTGSGNLAIGTNAMYHHKYNYNNTSVGYESMFFDTAGSYNVSVGWRSLRYVQNPLENVALGVGTLEFNDSCNYNVAVGRGAMIVKGGTYNTTLGYYASGFGSNVPTTNYRITGTTNIGAFAGWKNIADENTFVGYASGYGGSVPDSLSGTGNTAMGSYSYYQATTGINNSVFGYRAMFSNTTGNANVAMGFRALHSNNSGSYNIAIGDSAMFSGTASNRNVAIGSYALRNAGNGYQNVAVGDSAGYSFSGSFATAIGSGALKNATLTGNTALGYHSSYNITSGTYNTSVGSNSLEGNVNGSFNTALGYDADVAGSGFTNATAIGYKAMAGQSNSLILGSINGINGAISNTNVGVNTSTPDSIFSVSNNFLVGSNGTVQYDNNTPTMMYMFKSGTANAARMVLSHSTLWPGYGLQYTDVNDRFNFLSNWNNVMTVDLGLNRVGIGTPSPSSARLVLKGSANTNVTLAMQVVNSDSSNILVADNGRYVGVARVPDFTDITRGVLQVQGVGLQDIFGLYNAANTNRWTYFTSSTDLLMYNNGTLRGTWSATNGVYTSSSDRRLKKDISVLSDGVLGKLMKIPAYSFRYMDNKESDDLSIGFMAQEVAPYFPEAVTKITDKDGSEKLGIKYQYFSAYTVKAIQEQQKQIEFISEENKTLKAENEQLKKDIEQIKKKLGITN
jgi:hypothetical protein